MGGGLVEVSRWWIMWSVALQSWKEKGEEDHTVVLTLIGIRLFPIERNYGKKSPLGTIY
jgi:hypothetical protein